MKNIIILMIFGAAVSITGCRLGNEDILEDTIVDSTTDNDSSHDSDDTDQPSPVTEEVITENGIPQKIDWEESGNAYMPRIDFDGNGNAMAVWYQSDGSVYNIWACYFDGTSWGTAEKIESDDSGDARYPKVAFENSGKAMAVWYQSDGSVNNIWANYFNGTNWGTAEKIEWSDTGNAMLPEVAFDGNGKAMAVWYQKDGTFSHVYANEFNGTSWGTPVQIESNTEGTVGAGVVHFAFDDNGHAIAVWHQWDATNCHIWANTYDGTSWGTEEKISLPGTIPSYSRRAYFPRVDFDDYGKAIVVWYQQDGSSDFHVWANSWNGTDWGTAEQIESGDGFASRVRVLSYGNHKASAVWYKDAGSRDDVWTSSFNGSSWDTPELIEHDNSGSAFDPELAVDDNGNLMVVWSQSDGTLYNIMSKYCIGGTWESAVTMVSDNSGNAYYPYPAYDSFSDSFMTVWYQYSENYADIWACPSD